MDSDFDRWFDSDELTQILSKWKECMKNILKNNLPQYDQAIILSDYGYPVSKTAPMFAKLYSLALEELDIPYEVAFQEPKASGESAEQQIISQILKANSKTVVILSFSKRLGSLSSIGKSFRKYAKKNNIPFLSTSGLAELKTDKFDDFMNAVDIDYVELCRKGQMLKALLDRGNKITITTDEGTNLTIDISEFKAIVNDGIYVDYLGGNMPVGEVYIAPTKRTGDGKLVINISSKNRHGTTLIKEPITIEFKEGEAINITGGEEAEKLNESLEFIKQKAKHPWGIKLIGEIGIGINTKAEILGPTIVNEKKAGTGHIALGSNSWFGGDIFALNHYDQVFNNPKISIDGVPIDLKSILDY